MNEHTHRIARGMTLIELLVAIAITLLLLPVIYLSIQALYDTHATTLARAFAVVEATDAMQEIVRDVRGAVFAENGALPLVDIATSSLTLYADADLDGTVERVRYFLDGTVLWRGIIEPTSTSSYPEANESVDELASGMRNAANSTSVFHYYSATSSEITSMSQVLDVRRVEIFLQVEGRFGQQQHTIELRSSASIRNLKDQY